MKQRLWVIGILVLAFLGLADAAYLAQHATNGTPLLCNIQNLSGCNIVAASQYSRLFGIPLASYGIVFYGVIFVLAALELVIVDRLLRRVLQVASAIGAAASLIFLGIQFFIISAFCIYCLISAVISILIFVCAARIEPMMPKDGGMDEQELELDTREKEPSDAGGSGIRTLHMPPAL